MKKLFYLLVFGLIFMVQDCFATTNTGMLYEVGWQNSFVSVFAKDVTYERLDYNGWYIKSSVDDNIYYCIQPDVYMQNTSDAVSCTHNIYTNEEDIINLSRLDSNTLNRVKLLAYYGYNYKNHTDRKWYGITQVLIWRSVKPNVNWVFKESRYGNVNTNLFLSEIEEIEKLVREHNVIPSFSNTSLRLIKGSDITLVDTNNVLSNFTIDDNPYATFSINGNELTIHPLKEGKISLDMKRIRVNNDFSLFASNKFQNLITRGDISYVDASFDMDILDHEIYGLVRLSKLKGTDYDGYEKEDGAVFEIYDSSMELVRTLTTDSQGEAVTSLKYGDYIVKQVSGADGFSFTESFTVSITSEKEYFYELKNVGKSKLKLYKKDYSSGVSLPSARFNIFKEDGTLIYDGYTNEEGYLEVFNLDIGSYYIKEVESPIYYLLSNEIMYFDVTSLGKEIVISFTDERLSGSLKIVKMDSSTFEYLEGAVFEIYDCLTGLLVYTGSTDANGEIILEGILGGKYYLREVKAPLGYELNSDYIEFEIDSLVMVNVSVTNNKMPLNPSTSDNILGYIILFIIGLFSLATFYICNKKVSDIDKN